MVVSMAGFYLGLLLSLQAVLGHRLETTDKDVALDADLESAPSSPSEASTLAVNRACAKLLAQEFEHLVSSFRTDPFTTGDRFNLNNIARLIGQDAFQGVYSKKKLDLSLYDENQTLPEALNARFVMEDNVLAAGKASASKDQNALELLKDAIKARGFSVTAALSQCDKSKTKPDAASVHHCVIQVASSGKTFKKAGIFGGWKLSEKARENGSDESNAQLVEKLGQKWDLERLNMLFSSVTTQAARTQKGVTEQIKQNKKALAEANKAIQKADFDEQPVVEMCEKKLAKTAPAQLTKIAVETLTQMTEPVQKIDGKCVMKEGLICPEATSPQLIKMDTPDRAIAVYVAGLVVGNPISMGLFAGIGCLATIWAGPGCAVGASAGMGLATVLPTEWTLQIPFAYMARKEFYPSCRCYPDECVFEEAKNSCVVREPGNTTGGSPSNNPYKWLPYPGQKCVPLPSHKGQPQCAMIPCRAEDFQRQTAVQGVTGIVGAGPSEMDIHATYNCLSTDGSEYQQLLVQEDLAMLAASEDLTAPATYYQNESWQKGKKCEDSDQVEERQESQDACSHMCLQYARANPSSTVCCEWSGHDSLCTASRGYNSMKSSSLHMKFKTPKYAKFMKGVGEVKDKTHIPKNNPMNRHAIYRKLEEAGELKQAASP